MGYRILFVLILLGGCCSCLSYKISRQQENRMISLADYQACQPGETTREQVLERLGPPDRILTGWDDQGSVFTQFLYLFLKGRASDLTIGAPVPDIQRFNTGVQFFSLFLDALSGKMPSANQLAALEALLPDSYKSKTTQRSYRLSGMRDSLSGRARRLSQIRFQDPGATPVESRPLSEFLPLRMLGEGSGVDQIRLTFDETGILRLKAQKVGTPDTGFGDQMRDSVLQ